ncbi:MAG: nitroreductase family protein, partial [Verrucomicrobiota bacterium]
MDIDAFLELAKSRRATRYYTDDPLPEGVLEKMLEAARWAPSGFNMQPVHLVVVTDP